MTRRIIDSTRVEDSESEGAKGVLRFFSQRVEGFGGTKGVSLVQWPGPAIHGFSDERLNSNEVHTNTSCCNSGYLDSVSEKSKGLETK